MSDSARRIKREGTFLERLDLNKLEQSVFSFKLFAESAGHSAQWKRDDENEMMADACGLGCDAIWWMMDRGTSYKLR